MSTAEIASKRVDRYPTRAAAEGRCELMPREGRIVRGSTAALARAAGANDAASRFDSEGFLNLPCFFAEDEATVWRAEAERLAAWCIETRPQEAFFEGASGALRSLFDVVHHSYTFRMLVTDRRLLDIVTALLDDEPYVHQSRLNYKPPYDGTGFFWHSDFETWHAEDGMPDMHAVSISIALSANSVQNGPLMLVPGSHRTFVPCGGATPDAHYRQSLVEQRIGTPSPAQLDALIGAGGIAMPTGPAGSIVVFDCNTLHGSYDNLSADHRVNLFIVYNARSNALGAPFAAPRPRPEFIAARRRTTLHA